MTLSNRSSRVTLYIRFSLITVSRNDIEEKTIMKWEYNEPHTTNLHSPVEYNVIYTHHQDRQCLSLLELYIDVFISNSN